MVVQRDIKPLGQKAYGHIPHLPGSRIGPSDKQANPGQARICLERARDRHDVVFVQEKLDGSCTSVARVDGQLYPLGRAGYLASSSPYEQHQLFAQWVWANQDRFLVALKDGERLVGEWLAQAHGTRYALAHEPWVLFDVMTGTQRATWAETQYRAAQGGFTTPVTLHAGGPLPIREALALLGPAGHHGAIEPVEGCVWRVERRGAVDFLAKYVRPDKVDGCYLPELNGGQAVWNWRPTQ